MGDAVAVAVPPAATGATPPEQVSSVPRPDHIPEKFWDVKEGKVNVEAMAKSYKELEAKVGAAKPAEQQQQQVQQKPDEAKTLEDQQAEEIAKVAGVDVATLQSEYDATGSLSDDSYGKLAQAGIPKALVDEFIAGRVAKAQAQADSLISIAGGEEEFGKIAAWAQKSWEPAKLEQYNSAVTGSNAAVAEMALKALVQDYKTANPARPNIFTPANNPAAAGDVFMSFEQMQAAQKDPRYGQDPAYMTAFQAKLARSRNYV